MEEMTKAELLKKLQETEKQLQEANTLNEQLKEGVKKAEQTAKQALTEFKGVNETLSEYKKKLQETEEALQKVKEDYYNEVEDGNGATASIMEEAQLKNEAYGFIISQGLLDKFIAKRISREREPLEAALDYLLLSAEAFGDWIKDL